MSDKLHLHIQYFLYTSVKQHFKYQLKFQAIFQPKTISSSRSIFYSVLLTQSTYYSFEQGFSFYVQL